jgi:hypothetical protein
LSVLPTTNLLQIHPGFGSNGDSPFQERDVRS